MDKKLLERRSHGTEKGGDYLGGGVKVPIANIVFGEELSTRHSSVGNFHNPRP